MNRWNVIQWQNIQLALKAAQMKNLGMLRKLVILHIMQSFIYHIALKWCDQSELHSFSETPLWCVWPHVFWCQLTFSHACGLRNVCSLILCVTVVWLINVHKIQTDIPLKRHLSQIEPNQLIISKIHFYNYCESCNESFQSLDGSVLTSFVDVSTSYQKISM